MTDQEWRLLEGKFTRDECGGDMDWHFMRRVFQLRECLGVKMIVHEGRAIAGHAPDSYHYQGRALDFHCPDISPRRVLAAIDAMGFGGAGFYPWWAYPGFHIDDRPMDRYQRWLSPAKGEYLYLLRDAACCTKFGT